MTEPSHSESCLASVLVKAVTDILILSTKERRPEESFENVQCPVCGYYCLGNGGIGCINKPALCGLVEDSE